MLVPHTVSYESLSSRGWRKFLYCKVFSLLKSRTERTSRAKLDEGKCCRVTVHFRLSATQCLKAPLGVYQIHHIGQIYLDLW